MILARSYMIVVHDLNLSHTLASYLIDRSVHLRSSLGCFLGINHFFVERSSLESTWTPIDNLYQVMNFFSHAVLIFRSAQN